MTKRDPDECDHDRVTDEERHLGIFYAICVECDSTLSATGLEDEAGVPGWEIHEKPQQWVMDMGGYVVTVDEVA
jgi:hypothetical protein